MSDEQQQDVQTAEDRVTWINECLRRAGRHSGQWRKDARLAYDFRAGRQWTVEDRQALEEQRKPVITFNRIERAVRAVIGLEIQNRQEVRYMPRGVEDSKLSEVLGAAADWIRDNCDAEDEESEAFADLVTCGMGWVSGELDYDAHKDGTVVLERVDPLDMFWDPASRRKNLRDARWIAHVKRVTREDVVAMFPEFAGMIASTAPERWLEDFDDPVDTTPPRYDQPQPGASSQKNKELVCFQWSELVPIHRIVDISGQEREVDDETWQAAQAVPELMMQVVQHVEQKRRKYMRAYVCDGLLLKEEPLPVQRSGFSYKAITGARDRNANTFFGLVALMLDPQRFANKWLSQITHNLNKSAKGGLIAEIDAFANPRMAQESWAKAETITWANPGAVSGNKLQPKPEAPWPEGFGKLLEFAVNSIDNVPGISAEILGLSGNMQPAVLEESRKRAGFTILALFFDSIRLYRKEVGRLLAEYIQKYLSDGRLIRVVGKDGAQQIPLLRMPDAMEYDVVVDESPTSPNAKERTFALMTQLAPVLTQAGVPLPPDILDYSPLPSALVEKWKTHLDQTKQLPPQVQQAVEQMQSMISAQQAEIGKLSADKLRMETDKSLEVYQINAQAQVDRELAALKAQTEAQLAAEKSATETQKRAVEVYEANLKAMTDRMDMMISAFQQHAEQQMQARPQMLVTEQAAGGLSQALLPALAQLMEVSKGQVEQLGALQSLPDALGRLGEQITAAIQSTVAGSRLIASEPVRDPATGRLSAIKRRFADGSEDILPYGQASQTLQ